MTIRATAYHEAGHAVAAIYLNVSIEKVDIIGHERAAGRVIYADPDQAEQEIIDMWNAGDRDDARVVQWVEHRLIVTLAGAIAQRRFSPCSDWKYGMGHDNIAMPGSDIQTVIGRIDELGFRGKVAATYRAYLEAQAEALIIKHWPAIKKLAETLLWRKIMDADEVHQLLFGAYDDSDIFGGDTAE